MMRDYSTGASNNTALFVGIEIEKTAFFGLKTLFVAEEMEFSSILENSVKHGCNHVYLGANHSYNSTSFQWVTDTIKNLLTSGLKVTLDLKFKYKEDFKNCEFRSNPDFCLNIGLPFEDLSSYPINTYLKIDDRDFKASNEGVWVERLDKITTPDNFTDWYEYGKDSIV